jgi:hypothetical protein
MSQPLDAIPPTPREQCYVWLATPAAAAQAVAPGSPAPHTRRQVERAISRALTRHCAPSPRQNTSLSHSHGHVALGIAGCDTLIGVDLEYLRRRDVLGIAELAFDPKEAASLERLHDPERQQRFYELWTLKEAFAKALALDLLTALRRCRLYASASGWRADIPTDLAWSAVVVAPRPEFRLAVVRLAKDAESPECDLPATYEWPEPAPGPWSVTGRFTSTQA